MTWSTLRPLRLPSAALLYLSALGCQSAPIVTTTCEINSDCPAPLVCVAERCQAECVSQHDCLRGTHCTIVTGSGTCLIDTPLDHTSSPCGPGRACADAEQVCRDDTCWDGCATGDDCVPDSYCRNGVCANPDSPGFGYGFRRACTGATDCGAGEICASDHGSQAACRRPCAADTDCEDIAATATCAAIDDPAQPAGTMACVIGCDPVRQAGCLLHDRCELSVAAAPGGTTTVLECRAPTGMTIQGGACGTTAPAYGTCNENLGCAPANAELTRYECRRFCIVDADCRDPSLHCTGPVVMGIENMDVVVGVLHMCER